MVEVPDSTTRYIQSDTGKPTKDLFNWMRTVSNLLPSTGSTVMAPVYVNPVWYGADPTGVADSTAAFNAALAASTFIFFPPGKFTFNSTISLTLPNSIASIHIAGSGADVTELTWPGGTNGIALTFPNFSNSFHFRDLTFSTGAAGSASAVILTRTSASAFENIYSSDFTNVTFRGDDAYPGTNYWAIAVDIFQQSNILFENVTFVGQSIGGAYSTLGTGVRTAGTNSSGLLPVQYLFSNCFFQSVGAGILYGDLTQGVQVVNSNFVGGNYGIASVGGVTALVYLGVSNCQFNVATSGIFTGSFISNTFIMGSDFYVLSGQIGVHLLQADNFSIIGNHFQPISAGPLGIGIEIGTVTNNGGVISGNIFDGLTNGIVLDATSTRVNVQSNSYINNTTTVFNTGAGNTVGGGSA